MPLLTRNNNLNSIENEGKLSSLELNTIKMKNILYLKKLPFSLCFLFILFNTNLNGQGYDVEWSYFINTEADGSTLTKVAGGDNWGNGGAISTNFIPANTDGWTEFTVTDDQIDLMLGLSTPNNVAGFNSIKYAAHINPFRYYAYENGVRVNISGGYNIDDVFRVERIGNTVYYKRNGTIYHISSMPSTEALITDVSIYNEGKSVIGVKSSHPPGNPLVNVYPYQESFENGFNGWIGENSPNIWTHYSGNTPTNGTGPSGANEGVNYVYLEASNNENQVAILNGPNFELTDVSFANFQFQYHMWGTQVGSLKLEVTTDAGASWNTVWSKSGNQNDYWKEAEVDLNAYIGQTIKLRFYGQTGTGPSGDIAIDDLSLSTVDYNATSPCTTKVSTFPYIESFETGSGNWIEKESNNIWRRNFDDTPTAATGPSTANDGSYYYFIEASEHFPVKTAILESPCFDLSNETEAYFHFDHHMYGANMGTLNLEVSTDEGLNWDLLWAKNADQGDFWLSNFVDLSTYAGQIIQLRFRGVTGVFHFSDISIDNLRLTTTPPPTSNDCSTLITSFPYFESFESGFGDWETSGLPNIWRRNNGETETPNTGPDMAHNGSYYLYTEVSDPEHTQRIDYLEGPCFDLRLSSLPYFYFFYHMHGVGIGRLDLQISTNNGAVWSNIWTKQLDQGNTWQSANVDLSNYVGQIVKLRFKSRKKIFGANREIGDIAIDAIELIDFAAPSETISGSIEFPINDSNCGTSENNKVPNVEVYYDYDDFHGRTVSDANGNISVNNYLDGTPYTLYPNVQTSFWLDGVSTFDAFLLTSHIQNSSIFDCPYKLLAADVDGDGNLDQDDVDLIVDLIGENITSFPTPNWKFIPKLYVNSDGLHPDDRFVADFWNDPQEERLFHSPLRTNGKNYTYNGHDHNWLDHLVIDNVDFSPSCIGEDLGFFIVKTGDVNGTANFTSFPYPNSNGTSPTESTESELPEEEVFTINPLENNGSSTLQIYEARIVLNTNEKVVAYQLDFLYNDELIELGPISPNTEYLNQTESQNYGPVTKTSGGAGFKTVWVTDVNSHPEGVNIDGQEESTGVDGVTLFSFEFSSYKSLEHLRSAVRIDAKDLEPIFYSKDGPIQDVDLQIFIEEK